MACCSKLPSGALECFELYLILYYRTEHICSSGLAAIGHKHQLKLSAEAPKFYTPLK